MVQEYKRWPALARPVLMRSKSRDKSKAVGQLGPGEMAIVVESSADGRPVTTLTGTLDQAALQGLLHRLYSLGLPLISVNLDDINKCADRD